MDLDIDSDNNNGFDPPDGSDYEDQIEAIAGDPNFPGKIIGVNDADLNENGVPDYADGYAATEFDNSQEPSIGRFVSLVLKIGEGHADEDLRIARHESLDAAAKTPGRSPLRG